MQTWPSHPRASRDRLLGRGRALCLAGFMAVTSLGAVVGGAAAPATITNTNSATSASRALAPRGDQTRPIESPDSSWST
jgi:hypothetical protein